MQHTTQKSFIELIHFGVNACYLRGDVLQCTIILLSGDVISHLRLIL